MHRDNSTPGGQDEDLENRMTPTESRLSKTDDKNKTSKTVGPIRTDRYELQDHGPEYIRCGIKSVELLNILHLALPDNNLGLTEAKMIADMIKMNTLLKTLNLTNNKLDHTCAHLIGEALVFNDKLLKLDISQNEMGDLGILKLLKPLIKQRQTLHQ